MSHKFISLVFGIAGLMASGCGNSSATTQETGNSVMTTKTSSEIFPEVEFPKIELKVEKRAIPNTAEEAKSGIAAIEKLYNWSNVPPAINQDLSVESVFQFVKAIKLLKRQLPYDIDWLNAIDGSKFAGEDKFEAQSINNAKNKALERLEKYLPRDMEHSIKYTREFLISSFNETQMFIIKKGADCDMTNQSEVRNTLGRENINQLRADAIERVGTAFEAIEFLDKNLEIESDFSNERETFKSLVKKCRENLEAAAAAIQPPKDIGDKKLAEIATKVLANKKYKLGKPVRMIVNAPKRSHGKDHYTIDFSERSIEKSPYRWEEFQVATIEKEGKQYFLWYNTIIRYEVGPHTVPTKKWVLGPRHKSAPILKENIDN